MDLVTQSPPDWEQSDDNIPNTCLGRIDEFAGDALPTRKDWNEQRDAKAIHDR